MPNQHSPPDQLTHQQDHFAQATASGMNYTTAYRLAYDCSNMLPKTVNEEACRLAATPKIAARIAALRDATTAKVVAGMAWTRERVIIEAETNLQGARADGNWPAANGALAIAAGASGVPTSAARVEHSGQVDHRLRLDEASDALLDELVGLAPGALPPSTEPAPEPVVIEGSGVVVDTDNVSG